MLVLLMGLMTPLSGVYAQSYPPSAETKAETATDTAPVEAVAQTKSLKSFERDARLETMRYRHLWLAYAFICSSSLFRLSNLEDVICDQRRARVFEIKAQSAGALAMPTEILATPPVTHLVYIPFILIIGIVIGFVIGRQAGMRAGEAEYLGGYDGDDDLLL